VLIPFRRPIADTAERVCFGLPLQPTARVPVTRSPNHHAPTFPEVAPAAESYMSSEPRAIGLPAAPRLDSFPSPSVASRLDRPSHLSARVHPLLPSLLFEVSSPYLLVTSRRPVLPGFRPSSRHHARYPLIACALRRPLRSVLRFSQPLDGFLHLHAVRACFIPLPRTGFLRSGTSPDPDWASARRRIHSPMPLVDPRSPCGCHANLPRLRGFSLRIDALREPVV